MSEIPVTELKSLLDTQPGTAWHEPGVKAVLRNTLDGISALRAENERLRKELQGVANHLLSMSGGAHNCAGCGFLHKQIVRALAAPPEEK